VGACGSDQGADLTPAGFAVLGIVLALLFVQNSRPSTGSETAAATADEPPATTSA
jgi:hypothetical protein